MQLITWFKFSLVLVIYFVKLFQDEVENPGLTGCMHDEQHVYTLYVPRCSICSIYSIVVCRVCNIYLNFTWLTNGVTIVKTITILINK